MKTLLMVLGSISAFLPGLGQAQNTHTIRIDVASIASRAPQPTDWNPKNYHFDCRALMLFNIYTAPRGFGDLLEWSDSSDAKLFHFINYLHAKVGKRVVTVENFVDGNPIPYTLFGQFSERSRQELASYQAAYHSTVQKFADEFGETLTRSFVQAFQKYRVYSDDEIYQYLYLAVYRLNYTYGTIGSDEPGKLCEFKSKPGRGAQYHMANARYRVASFKHAQELILEEALKLAGDEMSAGIRTRQSKVLPDPPGYPFMGDWTKWFMKYGPHGRYSSGF